MLSIRQAASHQNLNSAKVILVDYDLYDTTPRMYIAIDIQIQRMKYKTVYGLHDTGAQINAISYPYLLQLFNKNTEKVNRLIKPDLKKIHSYTQTEVHLIGTIQLSFKFLGTTDWQRLLLHVVKGSVSR